MKRLRLIGLLIIFGITGVIFMQNSQAGNFTIRSSSFTNGEKLPEAQVHGNFGCTGENISPQLTWHGAPSGTKSFALIVHDPDAPRPNGWYHWIVLNIPVDTTSLKAGQQINPPMLQARNDFGSVTYGGACPPKGHGVHHYNFTIYALSAAGLVPTPNTPPASIARQVKAKALASATITALYERK